MTPALLDHSPHKAPDWPFGLEWSDAYYNGLEGNLWAAGVFVVAVILAIKTVRRGMRRKGDE